MATPPTCWHCLKRAAWRDSVFRLNFGPERTWPQSGPNPISYTCLPHTLDAMHRSPVSRIRRS